MTPDQPDIDHAARRIAGISALHQIRRLVDEETALEDWRARWAVRIGAVFIAIGAAILAWGFIKI